MDQAQAFLHAIRSEPEDDTPRLIYADWLEDQGQPERAAFIRAQVRLASLPEDDPTRSALEDEADDLLARHESQWEVHVQHTALEWCWRRGFIEQVTLSAEAFQEQGKELLAASLVREVRLLGRAADLRGLAGTPHLARVAILDLDTSNLSPSSLRVSYFRDGDLLPLATSPYLTGLRTLNLTGQGIEGPFLGALVESGLFGRLERLILNRNQSVGDRAVRRLVESSAERLLELNLSESNLTAAGLRTLLGAQGWPRLRRLTAPLGKLLASNSAPNGSVREVLGSPLWAHLHNLDLTGCSARSPLPASVLRDLLSSSVLANLRELTLGGSQISAESVEVLSGSPSLSQLRILDLGQGKVGTEGARALADSPHLSRLHVLGLAENNLGDAGAKALASGSLLGRLTQLDLSKNRIAGPGLKVVLGVKEANLRVLSLRENLVGPTGAELLAGSPILPGLTHLDLDNCNLGLRGVRTLSASGGLARLRVLSLRHNRLDNEAVKVLVASPALARLHTLHLDGNELDSPAAQALLDSPYLDRLRRLSLRGVQFSYTEQERLRARFGEGVVF